jgi:hypothetical protein
VLASLVFAPPKTIDPNPNPNPILLLLLLLLLLLPHLASYRQSCIRIRIRTRRRVAAVSSGFAPAAAGASSVP